jgi:uncharacterized membrane protein
MSKRKKKGQRAPDVLWAADGDQARWDELARGVSDVQLRLLYRNLQWAARQCAGAWSLIDGMARVVSDEQECRARSTIKEEE